jgi:putative transposase
MSTREITTEYRLRHWAGILQERVASGMSIKEFCKTSGIHENVYYYWQRKLREAACEELADRAKKEVASCETSLVPNGWAVCKAGEVETQGKPLVVEINGFRVHVEPDTAEEQLTRVCRALKSLC